MKQESEVRLRAHMRLNRHLRSGDADGAIRALADILVSEKLIASEEAIEYLRHAANAAQAAMTN